MKIFAVTNSKGGSCKTTSAVSIAGALAELGRRVLLVDMDPQASATRWLLGGQDHGDQPQRLLEGELPVDQAVVHTDDEHLDLLPANASLDRAARALSGQPAADRSLYAALRRLDPSRYDAVLIDCPPHAASFLGSNALLASDALVVPVETRAMALQGLASTIASAGRLEALLDRSVPIVAILACRLDRRTAQSPEVAEQIREYVEAHLPEVPVVPVRENVTLSDAFAAQLPVTSYAPRSSGAEDYRVVARTLLDRL